MKTKNCASYAGLVWRGQVSWSFCRLFLYRAFVLSEWSSRCCSDIQMILHNTQQYSTCFFFWEILPCWLTGQWISWADTHHLEKICAMVCYGQELDWMVINPLIGIYIPIVRIPNVGWMTIYCSLYTMFWPRWQLLITVVVLMFFLWGLVSSTTTSTHLLLASTRHSSTFAATWCNWHWLTSRAN